MRHQFTKAEQISGGAIVGRKTARLKLGIHGLSQEQRRENSARGGRTQGPIQGRQNVLTGQLDRIRELPQTKLAQSVAGKINGKATGLKYGPLVDMSRVRTKAGCKLGAAIGGPIGRHVRWHSNRGIRNFKCTFCLAEIEKTEGWGIVVKEPGF